MMSHSRVRTRCGMTVVEMSISLMIFAVLGGAVLQTVDLSHDSHSAVADVVADNETLREAAKSLGLDLRLSADTRITVTQLADENHEVTFQVPVLDGNVLSWGVSADYLGLGEGDEVDWSLRYTVEEANGERTLVRQILDDADVLQIEEVIAEGLRSGAEDPPGFQVEQIGDIWEITLSIDGNGVRSEEFHVWMRN